MRLLAWKKRGRTLLLTAALIVLSVGTASAQKGTVADGRDGKKYKTVKIGSQTWMAENLNYPTDSGSWCYNNSADSCKKYGRLYDWNTAKTVCMSGWHLPSRQEWNILVAAASGDTLSGQKLRARDGWERSDWHPTWNPRGTDDYGFSALPGGGRAYDGAFIWVNRKGFWWTATEFSGGNAYNRDMFFEGCCVDERHWEKNNGFSVRCVQDANK